jgi:hypothetical protein
MTVRNALKEIEDGLIRALGRLDRQRGARGGRERNVYRDYLLINLAIKWAELGREVTTGPKSEFVGFSESVANAIGWPTKGIDEAVRLRSVSDAEWLGIKAAAASRKSRRWASAQLPPENSWGCADGADPWGPIIRVIERRGVQSMTTLEGHLTAGPIKEAPLYFTSGRVARRYAKTVRTLDRWLAVFSRNRTL